MSHQTIRLGALANLLVVCMPNRLITPTLTSGSMAMLVALFAVTACAPHRNIQVQPPGFSHSAMDSARALVQALVERERLPGFAITVNSGRQLITLAIAYDASGQPSQPGHATMEPFRGSR